MLVKITDFDSVLAKLYSEVEFSFDTETTGLTPYKDSRMFLCTLSTAKEDYTFNFKWEPGFEDSVLGEYHLKELGKFFARTNYTVYMHNAKFDMHMMGVEGIEMNGTIHCTQAIGRLVQNDLVSYSLDDLAKKYLGAKKDDRVKKYIKEHSLSGILKRGKKSETEPYYWRVPLEVMIEYAELDTRLTFDLAMTQGSLLKKMAGKYTTPTKSIWKVYANETRLTKTLFRMEREGISISTQSAEEGLREETANYKKAERRFKELTGTDFVDSAKCLQAVFDKFKLPYGMTEKGNASFKDDMLKGDHEIVSLVREHRASYKRANSYFSNFLFFADNKGILHTDYQQGGAATGRLSSRSPALQTLPKKDEDNMDEATLAMVKRVRGCFVPRKDYFFFMPDYDQMEYRFMLIYAKEMGVIEEVNNGKDVHQAIADKANLTRSYGKKLSFGLLYGMGIKVLATMLKITVAEAEKVREGYFQELPGVAKFIRNVASAAKKREYIVNWLGRVSRFVPFYSKEYNCWIDPSYKSPNYLIQGGTADIVKIACNRIDELLLNKKSRLLLQVHDEVVAEIHKSEKYLQKEIIDIMEKAYPSDLLTLTASPEHSTKSLGDKVKGFY